MPLIICIVATERGRARGGPTRTRLLASVGLASLLQLCVISLAIAEDIPALVEVPIAIASTHTDLVMWRDRLASERNALRALVREHDAECRVVEKHSSEEASCGSSRARLSAELGRHISDSQGFNTAVGKAKGLCVKNAGYDLTFKMRDCANQQPSIFSYACLQGLGITEKSLACLATVPATAARVPYMAEAALAGCGVAATIPLDAYLQCQDIRDACVTEGLQLHKSATAKCLH